MFVAQAIAKFSSETMNPQPEEKNQEKDSDTINKRQRSKSQQKQLERIGHAQQQQQQEQQEKPQNKQQQQQQNQQQKQSEIVYLQFDTGDKILVRETYENGWWFGNTLKNSDIKGYFPSTFVKVGAKPPPPSTKEKKNDEQIKVFDPSQQQKEGDWMSKQLSQMKTGPVQSEYYQGIKGYKMVKIDEKNQNILKGNYVKFDVNTGLASVPIKDQAPAAKSVRQMGYYFDYHQWNQQRNKTQPMKARPDPRKKKQKKLRLKMMD